MKRGALVLVLALVLAACSDGRGEVAGPADRPAEETGDPVLLVTLGADETRGGGVDFLVSGWPHRLHREALPRRAVLVNLAADQATVADALASQLPQALDLRPTLATVWLGSYDDGIGTPVASYERDLAALVAPLTAAGARVLLAVGGGPPYVDATARVATATGADLVDLRDVPRFADQEALAAAFAAALGPVP